MLSQEAKKFYNQTIQADSEYEKRRWFKNDWQKAGYEMTKCSLEKSLPTSPIDSILEVGPGAGTWTKLLLSRCPKASLKLVDISKEMLALARRNLSKFKQIDFEVADFLQFRPRQNYSLFFSVRALEYMPDKKRVAEQIMSCLKKGGEGIIITKTPHYWRAKIRGRTVSALHRGQISPFKLAKIFYQAGARDIVIKPVVCIFPLFRSIRLNWWLYKIFAHRRLNWLSFCFSESYLIKFKKGGF
ncbi:class I SAM-dependent methyltransferase [Candidatus Parcubacteria bacterium]|nr:MAG: class I SAM-dependent methyltransferase [Candidatus Parcubacteria bacterium]